MAVIVICDSCSKKVDAGTAHTRGLVIQRQYCDECLPAIDAYMQDVDALHDELAAQWGQRLSALRMDIKSSMSPTGELPDVDQ